MPTSSVKVVLGHLRQAALTGEDAETTDGKLLGEFISRRDEVAFARLVRRHGPMVLGVCRRVLQHRQDAEDAFQATFIVLARKAGSVQPREQLGNWLHGVAYRTALEARRLAAKRRARERQVEGMPHPTVEPEQPWQDLWPRLDEELSRLPDRHRLPIVLCDLEGRTRKEVARQLGLPEGTLSNRLAAARQVLANRLIRRGLTLSGGALAAVLAHAEASGGVPASLVASTVNAAVGASVAVVSAQVAALTKGVLGSMFFTKLKIAMTVLVLVGLLGAGVGSAFLSYRAGAAEPPKEQPAPLHKAAPTQPVDRKRTVVERGSVKAALVSDLVWGLEDSTIAWVQEDGARVKKGDRLVEVNDARLREQLRTHKVTFDQAVSARAEAEASLARIRKENQLDARAGEVEVKLAKLRMKNTSKDRVEREILELKVEQAQIKLERGKLRGQAREARARSELNARATALDRETVRKRDLESRLASCVLRAPHDGIAVHVAARTGRGRPVVAVGEPVCGGQVLIRVHGMERFLVVVHVHEAQVARVRIGQSASVRIDAFPDRVFAGKVKNVAKVPSQQKWLTANVKVYPVEVELTEHPPGLKPEMSGEVRIDTERRKKPDGGSPE